MMPLVSAILPLTSATWLLMIPVQSAPYALGVPLVVVVGALARFRAPRLAFLALFSWTRDTECMVSLVLFLECYLS